MNFRVFSGARVRFAVLGRWFQNGFGCVLNTRSENCFVFIATSLGAPLLLLYRFLDDVYVYLCQYVCCGVLCGGQVVSF